MIKNYCHMVLVPGLHVDTCTNWIENPTNEQMCIGFKKLFAEKYHDLKLVQTLGKGQTGYHSTNSVVPTGYTASALNNLKMAATSDQSHANQMMVTIRQLTEMKKIRGNHIKHLAMNNSILAKQRQYKEKQ